MTYDETFSLVHKLETYDSNQSVKKKAVTRDALPQRPRKVRTKHEKLQLLRLYELSVCVLGQKFQRPCKFLLVGRLENFCLRLW